MTSKMSCCTQSKLSKLKMRALDMKVESKYVKFGEHQSKSTEQKGKSISSQTWEQYFSHMYINPVSENFHIYMEVC